MASPLLNVGSPATPPSARPIVDIQAWSAEVEQVIQPFDAIRLSPANPVTPSRSPRQASVRIAIPLDDQPVHTPGATTTTRDPRSDFATPMFTPGPKLPVTPRSHHTVNKRSEPIRRDSQKRRDALLKGKEGSRARRRWENDRLLANPHACPPLPSDWEVCDCQGRETFPYFLAPLWDAELRARALQRGGSAGVGFGSEERRIRAGELGSERQDAANVPRLVRQRIKKSRGAKGLLEDLERQVRDFIVEWDRDRNRDGGRDEPDSDDEEIVFVGRDAGVNDADGREAMPESPASTASERTRRERLVFESPAGDRGAAFGRWLVHSIATYYGLDTWSVTTGDPARREAYVAVRAPDDISSPVAMPRPLWAMV